MQDETTKEKGKLEKMIDRIEAIIEAAKAKESEYRERLDKVHPSYQKSARNLMHYHAFRKEDQRKLQKALGNMGLSRLAKSQSHVMASLQTNLAILKAKAKQKTIQEKQAELSFSEGTKLVKVNAKKLLGYRTKQRRTRIMVTMPSTAADDYEMVRNMIEAGMNCARINCAHDSPEVWKKIKNNIRKASKDLGKRCKIAMDLAGPKIRTGAIAEGPKVIKLRPTKDIWGRIYQPLEVWLGTSPKSGYVHVPVSSDDLAKLSGIETLYCRDTRDKKRQIQLVRKDGEGFIGHCWQTTFLETGMSLYLDKKRKETSLTVGELAPQEIPLLLQKGDLLRIDKGKVIGAPATYDEKGNLIEIAHISCTAPKVFEEVEVGQKILFDDGKIRGKIKAVKPDHMLIEIRHTAIGGGKLRADKGINLPDSRLTISGLTAKDREDLKFVAAHADVVNFSFVNRPEDVTELLEALEALGAKDKLGIILKIETQSGFNQLTKILLEAMQVYPVGVMIARGDLAIETGWRNIGRVQEEILSLCQAAHITDIWATQVLEGLAKKGIPSRAEITDAVMAQRADCVMLNKGPYILEAIQLLNRILTDMEPYWEKNAPLSPMMAKADETV